MLKNVLPLIALGQLICLTKLAQYNNLLFISSIILNEFIAPSAWNKIKVFNLPG